VQVRVLRARNLLPKDESVETRTALRERRLPPSGATALASAYCIITLDDLHRRQPARTRTALHSCDHSYGDSQLGVRLVLASVPAMVTCFAPQSAINKDGARAAVQRAFMRRGAASTTPHAAAGVPTTIADPPPAPG
jgi:hypothetical protein